MKPQARRGVLLALLLAQVAFGLVAMALSLPSMPSWGTLFGAEQAEVQLVFSGYVFAFAALQLLYGPLSDRHGRKRVLVAGAGLACAGSFLCAMASGLASLVAARVLQGAGSAAGMVVGRAMVQDLFDGPGRTRVMAYVGMVMGLCPPLAMLVGGQIHVLLGWRANFILVGVMALVLCLASWLWLPDGGGRRSGQADWLRDMWRAYARLAREPVFLLYVSIVAMTTATFYTFLAGAPIVLKGYGIGPDRVGWYVMFVSISYVAGNFLTSRLIGVHGERRMLVLGHACSLTGLGTMLALAWAGLTTPLVFAVPLVLLGLGHGFTMPPALSGSVGAVPALAGAAAAVAGLAQQLTGGFGGYAVGLVRHDGAVNLGWLMLGFTLVGFAALVVLRTRTIHLR